MGGYEPTPGRVSTMESDLMKTGNDFGAATEWVLRLVRLCGHAVSVFHMAGYVELHAVHLSGDHVPHVARCEGTAMPRRIQRRVMAEMVGVRISE